MTVIGVSWMKGDMGYMKTFPAIKLKKDDILELTMDPEPGKGGYYKVITTKNLEMFGVYSSLSGVQVFETSFSATSRDVDKYDYLLEEK